MVVVVVVVLPAAVLRQVLPLAAVWASVEPVAVSVATAVVVVVVVMVVATAVVVVVVGETVELAVATLVVALWLWLLAGSVRWAAILMAGNYSKAPEMVFLTASPLQSAKANQHDWQTESLWFQPASYLNWVTVLPRQALSNCTQ